MSPVTLALLLFVLCLSAAPIFADNAEIQDVRMADARLQSLLQQGQAKAALSILSILSKDVANHPSIRLHTARALAQLQRYHESIEILQSLLKQFDTPGLASVSSMLATTHLMLGRAYFMLTEYTTAETHLHEVLRIEAHNREATIYLSKIMFVHHGNIPEALSMLQSLTDLYPDDPDVLFPFAEALLESGNATAAKSLFDRIALLSPRMNHKHVGFLYYHAGQISWAMEEFQLYLFNTFRFSLGAIVGAAHLPSQASGGKGSAKAIGGQVPFNVHKLKYEVDVFLHLAHCYHQSGDLPAAQQLYNFILNTLQPSHPEAHYSLATALLGLGGPLPGERQVCALHPTQAVRHLTAAATHREDAPPSPSSPSSSLSAAQQLLLVCERHLRAVETWKHLLRHLLLSLTPSERGGDGSNLSPNVSSVSPLVSTQSAVYPHTDASSPSRALTNHTPSILPGPRRSRWKAALYGLARKTGLCQETSPSPALCQWLASSPAPPSAPLPSLSVSPLSSLAMPSLDYLPEMTREQQRLVMRQFWHRRRHVPPVSRGNLSSSVDLGEALSLTDPVHLPSFFASSRLLEDIRQALHSPRLNTSHISASLSPTPRVDGLEAGSLWAISPSSSSSSSSAEEEDGEGAGRVWATAATTSMELGDFWSLSQLPTVREVLLLQGLPLHQYLGRHLTETWTFPPPLSSSSSSSSSSSEKDGVYRGVSLWAGRHPFISSLRYAAHHQVLVVLSGQYEVLLLSPEEGDRLDYRRAYPAQYNYIYPFNFTRPVDQVQATPLLRCAWQADRDIPSPSLSETVSRTVSKTLSKTLSLTSRLASATTRKTTTTTSKAASKKAHKKPSMRDWRRVVLQAGDVLSLPAYWHYEVQGMSDEESDWHGLLVWRFDRPGVFPPAWLQQV